VPVRAVDEAIEAEELDAVGDALRAQGRSARGPGRAVLHFERERPNHFACGDVHCATIPPRAAEQCGRNRARHGGLVQATAEERGDARALGRGRAHELRRVDAQHRAIAARGELREGVRELGGVDRGEAVWRDDTSWGLTPLGVIARLAFEHVRLRRHHVCKRPLRHDHPQRHAFGQRAQQRVDHLERAAPRDANQLSRARVAAEVRHERVLQVAARVARVGGASAIRERLDAARVEHLHQQRRARARDAGDDRDEVAERASHHA
jgi:hypothetical protein